MKWVMQHFVRRIERLEDPLDLPFLVEIGPSTFEYLRGCPLELNPLELLLRVDAYEGRYRATCALDLEHLYFRRRLRDQIRVLREG